MKRIYLNCENGISGDMVLNALQQAETLYDTIITQHDGLTQL